MSSGASKPTTTTAKAHVECRGGNCLDKRIFPANIELATQPEPLLPQTALCPLKFTQTAKNPFEKLIFPLSPLMLARGYIARK